MPCVLHALPLHPLQEPLVGTFPFASSKQSHSNNAHQGRCLAHMFVMRVAEELDTWPEWPQRRRCWVRVPRCFWALEGCYLLAAAVLIVLTSSR